MAPEKYSVSITRLGDDAVRSIAKPLILRRRKGDVLPDLPEVDEHHHYVELTEAQRESYIAKVAEVRDEDKGSLLRILGELLGICDADPRTGASSKIDDIVGKLGHVGDEGEKAVIFSYRLRPLDSLVDLLSNDGIKFARIDGRMDAESRDAELARFRRSPEILALIASSRVASEGLTLTEANHAFFINRWWNPSEIRTRLEIAWSV